jgi:GT2 family glycosyltransferase
MGASFGELTAAGHEKLLLTIPKAASACQHGGGSRVKVPARGNAGLRERFARRPTLACGSLPVTEMRAADRPRVQGKFLQADGARFWIRGVTYGTFRPRDDGSQFPSPAAVERDFRAMAAAGFNTVRTYTAPPRWLLDAAGCHGLRVLAGLWWPSHLAFLDDRRRRGSIIVARVRADARRCAGHPAVLALAIGNEIPASLVRWHGARAVTRFLETLHDTVKSEDPDALVTYVNYPSTEYLELPFLDVVGFNVYLESRRPLRAYLARLQNLAGDRPLILGELGLDSLRNGEARQAATLSWQLRAAFAGGAAGAFVYAWTDEWYAGGQDMTDWAFGLTRRDRTAKPALAAVSEALRDVPFAREAARPLISVVVCSYNGARTIRETLDGLARLDYPRYEVIVVDDGSTDETAAIAGEYEVRTLSGPNRGLSHARNVGWRAARGDIVAYIDDDAAPDPHWLAYLAEVFARTGHGAVGGPNLPPPDDGDAAACVARAPGGPVHVLVSDVEAEHIPGCNMAFRRRWLEAIGGFDERFRRAGDDVDVCWRLSEAGATIGFSPAAVVWHHRRNSVGAYFRQQRGYGEAEALLERKWPEKYNALGHASWRGRLYGAGAARGGRGRIYRGTWNSAPFQSLYRRADSWLAALPALPEWYMGTAALALLALLGLAWAPLAWTLALAGVGALASASAALREAVGAAFPGARGRRLARLRALTWWLHLVQPLARLRGRLDGGLTPWRRRAPRTMAWPRTTTWHVWTETRREPEAWLADLEGELRRRGHVVRRGSGWDAWDLEIRTGMLGAARVAMAHEEHGGGRQLVRFRMRPRPWRAAWIGTPFALFALLSGASGAAVATAILGSIAAATALRGFTDCALAAGALRGVWTATARPPATAVVSAVAADAQEAA